MQPPSGMEFVDLTPKPTLRDRLWQTAYRVGFPLAKVWWRVRRQGHVGALVAVEVGGALLLLRSSYRSAWNFPGGGLRAGESPAGAARRELLEETGVSAPGLDEACVVSGVWEGREDEVHIFRLRLDEAPALRLDNREIVGACLVGPAELAAMELTAPVRVFIERRC